MTRIILLIEDDADIREALADALAEDGYQVACASNGAEGLALALSVRPALVLLDLMMPGMSGSQFRAAQRMQPEIAAIPVVVLTADGRIDDRANELQADGKVRKPIDYEELLATIEALTS